MLSRVIDHHLTVEIGLERDESRIYRRHREGNPTKMEEDKRAEFFGLLSQQGLRAQLRGLQGNLTSVFQFGGARRRERISDPLGKSLRMFAV